MSCVAGIMEFAHPVGLLGAPEQLVWGVVPQAVVGRAGAIVETGDDLAEGAPAGRVRVAEPYVIGFEIAMARPFGQEPMEGLAREVKFPRGAPLLSGGPPGDFGVVPGAVGLPPPGGLRLLVVTA